MRLAWNITLVFAAAALVAGAWLAFDAWKLGSQRHAMIAVVLLLSAPVLAVAVILARPRGSIDAGNSRAGILVDAIHQVDDSLRMVQLCRAHIGVACAGACVFWVCEWFGYYRLMEFLVFFTVACIVTAAACLPWLASRERRLYDDRAEYRRLLGEAETLAWSNAAGKSDTG